MRGSLRLEKRPGVADGQRVLRAVQERWAQREGLKHTRALPQMMDVQKAMPFSSVENEYSLQGVGQAGNKLVGVFLLDIHDLLKRVLKGKRTSIQRV